MEVELVHRHVRISWKVIVALLGVVLALLLFGALAQEVVIEKEDWFDTRAFTFIKAHVGSGLLPVFRVITFFGSSVFLLPAYSLLVLYLLVKKKTHDAVSTGLMGILSSVLLFALKLIYARHRPELPAYTPLKNFSFPSGHSMSSLIFFAIVFGLCWDMPWKKWIRVVIGILLAIFVLLIAASRIVLRYHYASDVVAGLCLGLASAIMYLWVRKRMAVRKQPAHV